MLCMLVVQPKLHWSSVVDLCVVELHTCDILSSRIQKLIRW